MVLLRPGPYRVIYGTFATRALGSRVIYGTFATLVLGSRVIYGTFATLPLGSRVIYWIFATPALGSRVFYGTFATPGASLLPQFHCTTSANSKRWLSPWYTPLAFEATDHIYNKRESGKMAFAAVAAPSFQPSLAPDRQIPTGLFSFKVPSGNSSK